MTYPCIIRQTMSPISASKTPADTHIAAIIQTEKEKKYSLKDHQKHVTLCLIFQALAVNYIAKRVKIIWRIRQW